MKSRKFKVKSRKEKVWGRGLVKKIGVFKAQTLEDINHATEISLGLVGL